MKAMIISDLHIKKNNDTCSQLLSEFFRACDQVCPDRVIFLGDIFDMMAGNYKDYITEYPNFFDGIKNQLELGRKVYYFEGNHDFHIGEVFQKFLKENMLDTNNFYYERNPILLDFNGKKVLLGHGDDLDYNNESYKKWKRIYSSGYFKFFLNKVLTYKGLKKIGNWASSDSKKRGSKTFDYNKAKDKYRKGASVVATKEIDYLIAGHTHIKDDHTFEFEGKKIRYLNNGFPLHDRVFIKVDDDINLVPLDSFS
jgi:UDP-2,3-diacylglucosamine hydrolase